MFSLNKKYDWEKRLKKNLIKKQITRFEYDYFLKLIKKYNINIRISASIIDLKFNSFIKEFMRNLPFNLQNREHFFGWLDEFILSYLYVKLKKESIKIQLNYIKFNKWNLILNSEIFISHYQDPTSYLFKKLKNKKDFIRLKNEIQIYNEFLKDYNEKI